MNKTLYDLSGKIEPSLINALLEITKIAGGINLDFFLVGATARDIMLEHVHNLKAPRMTKDIDIAVCVANWEEYRAFTEGLIGTGRIHKRTENHRYDFAGIFIDMLPFGGIAGRENQISWPPDRDTIMSTVGFDDIYKNAMTIRLNREPVLDIKVATIPGLAIMKLLAWNDAFPTRKKDAEDLLFIMRAYQRAGIEDRLYDQEERMLVEEEFDNERAGIRLLGRDMARISSPDTAIAIKEILDSETGEKSRYRLISQMESPFFSSEAVMFILEKLKQGFDEPLGS